MAGREGEVAFKIMLNIFAQFLPQ